MMRICVAGGSHVVALKQGWKSAAPSFPEVAADFFPASTNRIPELVAVEGALAPGNKRLEKSLAKGAEGRTAIAGDYDAYLVCGLRCSVHRAVGARRNVRDTGEDRRWPASESAWRDAVVAVLRDTPAAALIAKIGEIARVPVVLIAAPMPRDGDDLGRLSALRHRKQGEVVASVFHAACDAFAREFGAQYFPQPSDTLATPLTTSRGYATGGLHLTAGRDDDHAHMNADYGAAVLRDALQRLTGAR